MEEEIVGSTYGLRKKQLWDSKRHNIFFTNKKILVVGSVKGALIEGSLIARKLKEKVDARRSRKPDLNIEEIEKNKEIAVPKEKIKKIILKKPGFLGIGGEFTIEEAGEEHNFAVEDKTRYRLLKEALEQFNFPETEIT